MKFEIAVNRHFIDKLPQGDPRWAELNDTFETVTLDAAGLAQEVQAGHPFTAPHRRERHRLPSGRLSAYRHALNFISAQHLALDCDHVGFAALLAEPMVRDYASLLYTTASHTPEDPRTRVVFILDQPITDPLRYGLAASALVWKFDGQADSSCKDPARLFFGAKGCQIHKLGTVLPIEVVNQWCDEFAQAMERERAQRQPRRDYAPDTPDLMKVADALKCIPPHMDYLDWLRVGMGIHSEYPGSDGIAVLEQWSPGYPGEWERKFTSFSASGNAAGKRVGIGTVFHMAQQYGWQKAHRNGHGPAEPEAPSAAEETEDVEPRADGPLPEIVVTARPLRDQTADALDALAAANDPPTLLIRSATVVRIGRDEYDLPLIRSLSEDALRGRLARYAEFMKVTAKGDTVPIAPPLDVVRDILSLGTWPMLPALAGIIEAPTLRPDGTPVTTPGYDAATQLYYVPAPGLTLPPIPNSPTDADIDAAINLLLEIVCDFPFTDDAGKANWLAAMLTPVARPLIAGPVPMGLFDAPQSGTGKSLLAEVVAFTATGRSSAMLTAPENDEGWRKAITSLLLAGRQVATVDNVEGKLYAPSLAAALTSTTWQDRILGGNEMVTLPHRMTWLVTGNNIRLGGDLPRRCYHIRIDAQDARPWQRTAFRHPHLLEWVTEQRGRILTAILTLARGWILAGRPTPADLPVLGSFEGWTNVIGGILHHVGVTDFLGNLEEMYEQADDDTPQWEGFLTAWFAAWGDKAMTVAEVAEALGKQDTVKAALPDDLADALSEKKSFNRRLGNALSKRNGMRLPCGLSVRKSKEPTRTGAVRWVVKK